MNYRDFANEVKEQILNYMPPEYAGAEVKIQDALKNNGILRHGLTMRKEGESIVPSLYLDEAYHEYGRGVPLEEICVKIAKEYSTYAAERKEFNADFVTNFDNSKDMITTRVVNAHANKELLMMRPFTKLDDLAVIYQIDLGKNDNGYASVALTNKMMDEWGLTTEDIHDMAVENTERLHPTKMSDLQAMLFGQGQNLLNKDNVPDAEGVFILTNEDCVNGASVLANKKLLGKVSDIVSGSYYVIPSSIHEVLILTKDWADKIGLNAKEMGNMVRDVNKNEVSKEDLLSDHVYLFNRDARELETVKESKVKDYVR